MTLFVLSVVPLVAGPLLVRLLQSAQRAARLLDAFLIVSVGGLIFLHILPHAIGRGGLAALLAAIVGLLLPLASGKLWHGHQGLARNATLIFALVALGMHATIDGLALAHPDEHHHGLGGQLALAIVLHRLPVGLGIWWLVRPRLGLRVASLTVALIVIATTVGFFGAARLSGILTGVTGSCFQALVAGSLVHMVVGHRHGPAQAQPHQKWRPGSAVGALLGVALLALLAQRHESSEMAFDTLTAGQCWLALALQSAPVVLLSFVLAGLCAPWWPPARLRRLSDQKPVVQSLVGALVSSPWCSCSCAVASSYRALLRRGIPAPAATALLVAAPEVSLATVLLSLKLLGLEFGLARLGAAVSLALLMGWWVGRQVPSKQRSSAPASPQPPTSDSSPTNRQLSFRAFWRSFGENLDRSLPWLLVGLGLAALLEPLLEPGLLARLSPGLDVALMALLGLVVYSCAFGFTPLLVVLVDNGLSPGAAITLLLVGSATNLAVVGMLSRLHGRRFALIYGVTVTTLAAACGLLANHLIDQPSVSLRALAADAGSVFNQFCLALLALVTLVSLWRQGAAGFIAQLRERAGRPGHHHCHDH